jgi:hypothetical protein
VLLGEGKESKDPSEYEKLTTRSEVTPLQTMPSINKADAKEINVHDSNDEKSSYKSENK